MKQLFFLSAMTICLSLASIQIPFWGIFLYYTFAVLRPQYLWKWALPVDVRWSLIAACVVIFSMAIHFNKILRESKYTSMFSLIVVYSILLAGSMLVAFNPAVAQAWAIEYGKILIIALIALLVINQVWQIRAMATMIFLCLGYIAWEINFLYFFRNGRLDIFHYGYGGMDNNGAGLMLAMGIPFAYYAAISTWERWGRAIFIIASGIGLCMVHSVMMSFSRGAMLAAIAGLLWVFLRHRSKKQAAALFVILTCAILFLSGSQIRERFISTMDYKQDISAQSRFESWSAAWTIAWEHPLLGKGIRNSNIFSQNYGADYSGRTIHNQYLQIAADSGVPAALLFIGLIGFSFYLCEKVRSECLYHLRRGMLSDKNMLQLDHIEKICLAVQASLIIFAVDSMFLSLEVFELPWVLFVISGVMPHSVRMLMKTCTEDEKQLRSKHKTGPVRIPPRRRHHPEHGRMPLPTPSLMKPTKGL